MIRLLIVVAALVFSTPTHATGQVKALPLVTNEFFWKYCSQRNSSDVAMAWCWAYIAGYADAAVNMYRLLGERGPGYCWSADGWGAFVEKVLTYMPVKHDKDVVAPALAGAVAAALHCD